MADPNATSPAPAEPAAALRAEMAGTIARLEQRLDATEAGLADTEALLAEARDVERSLIIRMMRVADVIGPEARAHIFAPIPALDPEGHAYGETPA